jgi:hypothetical protein
MADVDDERVLAYIAARDLAALYDAYRASSRAHLLVLLRIGAALNADPDPSMQERLDTRIDLVRRGALARETDAVFAVRVEQLRHRLLELRGLPA